MRTWPALLIICTILPFVAGEGILAQTPTDNATVEQGAQYTFSATSDYREVPLTACQFMADGVSRHTLNINDRLGGSIRRFTPELEAGTYSWNVACETATGDAISSETRTVTVTEKVESPVKVTSSGVTRGSLRHTITMKSTTEPVTVKKISPGDYVEIIVTVKPSNLKRDYYVKGKYAQDSKNYIILAWKQESHRIDEGETVTLPVESTKARVQFVGLENNKITLIISPYASQAPAEETPEEAAPPQESAPEETPEETAPPEEIPPVEEQLPETTPEPPSQPEKQGFFTRFFSLLARLFGA